MADTVTITSGAASTLPDGTKILTDDTGAGGHAQIIKLAIATDGSATLIPATVADGLLVTVAAGSVTASGTIAAESTTSGAATTATVGDSASSVTLLASSDSRKGFSILNDSTAILYVKFGATASTTSFVARLAQYERFADAGVGIYTGIIDGIWASDAGGNARVTSW